MVSVSQRRKDSPERLSFLLLSFRFAFLGFLAFLAFLLRLGIRLDLGDIAFLSDDFFFCLHFLFRARSHDGHKNLLRLVEDLESFRKLQIADPDEIVEGLES